ncbi:MAG: response regulator [Bacteroidetes bacterium]|nr:MAG: response regulator [Bacteroidota bacterium]
MPGVLLVEDDKELREMLKISLLRRKFTVLEAIDGKEAITHFKPSITDLVVTDLIMPNEDGLKVIMKLRELKPTLKIIAISGGGKAGPGSYLNLAKALGADAVYSKPFSTSDLIARIEELLTIEQPS